MKELPEDVRAAALEHAILAYPRESCGLVIVERGRMVYVRCKNLSASGDQFAMCPTDYAAAEDRGEVVAVVHSHPDAPANPSQADLVACEASGLPWWIVGLPSATWRGCAPSGYRAPLVGREFHHGVLDCYALMRDAYRELCGIELPEFHREDDWWHRGQNLYLDNFEAAGFVRVPDESLRVHDALLMKVISPVPNHAAMLVEDNIILHHLHGRLSSRDVFGGYYRKVVHCTLRHRSLME